MDKFIFILCIFLIPAVHNLSITKQYSWDLKNMFNIIDLGKLEIAQKVSLYFQPKNSLSSSPRSPTIFVIIQNKNIKEYSIINLESLPTSRRQICLQYPCDLKFDPISQTQNYSIYLYNFPSQTQQLWGNLKIWSRNQQGQIRQLLKISTTNKLIKSFKIYVTQTQNYTITQYSSNEAQTKYMSQQKQFILMSKVGQVSDLNSDGSLGPKLIRSQSKVQGNLVYLTWQNIKPGFYLIFVLGQIQNFIQVIDFPEWKLKFSYQTQPYQCLYDASFPDINQNLAGCTFDTQSLTLSLPCLQRQNNSLQCTKCISGYFLFKGKCYHIICPFGQYKKYGQCYQNPIGCQIFNEFQKCTKCLPTYILKQGYCSRIPLKCSGRTFFNPQSYQCSPVDRSCLNFNQKNGQCTSCNNLVQFVSHGKCINLECSDRQYILNDACHDIDNQCLLFQKLGGKCYACHIGYTLNQNKKCTKINCPQRHFVNQYGNCVKVSDLCIRYDERGRCLQCIPTHINNMQGQCLQIYKYIICNSRQYIGQDGECYDLNPLCGKFDRINGKCLTCANNQDYILIKGNCQLKKKCHSRQWIDQKNNCVDVNNNCNNFNIINGQCLDCKYNYKLFDGICCDVSQNLINGQCRPVLSVKNNFKDQNYFRGCAVIQNNRCIHCYPYFRFVYDIYGIARCINMF